MYNEKSNESFHWKRKLEELDHVPGAGAFDKTAGWEKLHGRLGKKGHSGRRLWYWSAAACLLLILGMQFIRISPNKTIVKSDEQHTHGKSSDRKILVSNSNDTLVRSAKIVAGKKHTIVEKKITESKQKIEKIVATQEHNVPSSLSTGVADTLTTIIEQPDAPAIVSLPLIKKKLRVVHINDLDNSLSEDNQFARHYKSPSFKTRLNQEVFPDLTVSRNNSDNILKIKLSPSN